MGWMLRNCPHIAHLSYCVILSRFLGVRFCSGGSRVSQMVMPDPRWTRRGGWGIADPNLFLKNSCEDQNKIGVGSLNALMTINLQFQDVAALSALCAKMINTLAIYNKIPNFQSLRNPVNFPGFSRKFHVYFL